MPKQLLTREALVRSLVFLGISLIIFFTYYPALFFPPRADQVAWMAEVSHRTTAADLILGVYDMNRHSVHSPGDESLFRPITFGFLGAEQYLFGHNFWAWQLVNIVAHLLLVLILLTLLWRLTDPWMALGVAGLFGMSLVCYELVTWSHMSVYLVMIIFFALALDQLVVSLKDDLTISRLIKIIIYLSVACFMYETISIFVVWIVLYVMLFYPKLRLRILFLLIPVFFYALFSWYNFVHVNHLSLPAASKGGSFFNGLISSVQVLLWWLYEGFFCGMYHYKLAVRTMFQANEVMVFLPLNLLNIQVLASLILLTIYAWLIWLNRNYIQPHLKMAFLFIGMVFIYVGVIVFGRQSNPLGIEGVIRINSYYIYLFWILVLISAFVLLGSIKQAKVKTSLIIVFVVASLISGLWQAKQIHQMTNTYAQNTNKIVVLIKTIDLLIEEHGKEADFSFFVQRGYPGNYPMGTLRKNTDPIDKEYTLIEYLYPQYFRPKEFAKYKLLVS